MFGVAHPDIGVFPPSLEAFKAYKKGSHLHPSSRYDWDFSTWEVMGRLEVFFFSPLQTQQTAKAPDFQGANLLFVSGRVIKS